MSEKSGIKRMLLASIMLAVVCEKCNALGYVLNINECPEYSNLALE